MWEAEFKDELLTGGNVLWVQLILHVIYHLALVLGEHFDRIFWGRGFTNFRAVKSRVESQLCVSITIEMSDWMESILIHSKQSPRL